MKKIFLLVLAVLSLVVLTGNIVGAQSSVEISRIQGGDRYATAVGVSRTFYPDGASKAYVANGNTMVDALSAGPSVDGPVLLVAKNYLPPITREELQRLNPTEVIILGGPGAVSATVEKEIYNSLANGAAQPEDQMEDLINEERVEILSHAADVSDVSENWSGQMETERQLSHNPNYMKEICCWERLTENVGVISISSTIERAIQAMHNSLMNSEGHRENIVDSEVDEVGIGIVIGDCPNGYPADSECLWATQNFRG